MFYRIAADIVLAFHFTFVVFAVAGGLLVLRWPRLMWLHLPVLAWGIWIELSGEICPLTPLEVLLRQRGGESGYEGGFIEHYITPLLYPAGLTRETQWRFAATLILINIVSYAVVFRRRRSRG